MNHSFSQSVWIHEQLCRLSLWGQYRLKFKPLLNQVCAIFSPDIKRIGTFAQAQGETWPCPLLTWAGSKNSLNNMCSVCLLSELGAFLMTLNQDFSKASLGPTHRQFCTFALSLSPSPSSKTNKARSYEYTFCRVGVCSLWFCRSLSSIGGGVSGEASTTPHDR